MLIFLTYNVVNKNQHLWICNEALSKFALSLESMQRVARVAAAARVDTLPVDVAFKGGMSSYMFGTRQLRIELLPLGWHMYRNGGVESVINDKHEMQIQFQNVDVACVPGYIPQPISLKGKATKQQIMQGGQLDLFPKTLNQKVDHYLKSDPVVWWLCVSSNEQRLCAELSQPDPFQGKYVQSFNQRIFLLDESIAPEVMPHLHHNNETLDFEIEVTRNNTYV